MMRFLIGIDETGRGPLAGPVAVGLAAFPADFDWSLAQGVRDSKQLTALQRDEWYQKMCAWSAGGLMYHKVVFSSSQSIDRRGIVPSVYSAIERGLKLLELGPRECEVRLDGTLKAPAYFLFQKTIIRGDESEPAISLAAIAAKVRRDRLMRRLAKMYPQYGFDIHKGYGTSGHREAIRQFGLCDMHRRSFCRNFAEVLD